MRILVIIIQNYAYLFQTLRTVYICSLVQIICSVHKGRLENRQIVTRHAFYGVLALLVCMWLDMVALLLMIISHKDSMATWQYWYQISWRVTRVPGSHQHTQSRLLSVVWHRSILTCQLKQSYFLYLSKKIKWHKNQI